MPNKTVQKCFRKFIISMQFDFCFFLVRFVRKLQNRIIIFESNFNLMCSFDGRCNEITCCGNVRVRTLNTCVRLDAVRFVWNLRLLCIAFFASIQLLIIYNNENDTMSFTNSIRFEIKFTSFQSLICALCAVWVSFEFLFFVLWFIIRIFCGRPDDQTTARDFSYLLFTVDII